MMIVLVAIFAVCWLPYQVYFLVIPLFKELTHQPIVQEVFLGEERMCRPVCLWLRFVLVPLFWCLLLMNFFTFHLLWCFYCSIFFWLFAPVLSLSCVVIWSLSPQSLLTLYLLFLSPLFPFFYSVVFILFISAYVCQFIFCVCFLIRKYSCGDCHAFVFHIVRLVLHVRCFIYLRWSDISIGVDRKLIWESARCWCLKSFFIVPKHHMHTKFSSLCEV